MKPCQKLIPLSIGAVFEISQHYMGLHWLARSLQRFICIVLDTDFTLIVMVLLLHKTKMSHSCPDFTTGIESSILTNCTECPLVECILVLTMFVTINTLIMRHKCIMGWGHRVHSCRRRCQEFCHATTAID